MQGSRTDIRESHSRDTLHPMLSSPPCLLETINKRCVSRFRIACSYLYADRLNHCQKRSTCLKASKKKLFSFFPLKHTHESGNLSTSFVSFFFFFLPFSLHQVPYKGGGVANTVCMHHACVHRGHSCAPQCSNPYRSVNPLIRLVKKSPGLVAPGRSSAPFQPQSAQHH